MLDLVGASNGARRELDFYPTPPEVTIALMEFLRLPKCTIWECAAGEGHISKVLRGYGHNVIETDIASGDDYLKSFRQADAIITNPPFNLSEQFIVKAVQEAEVVAMLLKSQYWHAKKRLNLFQITMPQYVLPLTWRPDFLMKGGSPTMEVCWTVWSRGQRGECRYVPLSKESN